MVALVFCGDLKYCPYIKRYVERLELQNIEYKVYFWNRGDYQLNLPLNYEYFDTKSDLNKGKIAKAIDFLKYRAWILKKLKDNDINKVVALSTLTGVILGRHLYNKKQYVFDIRDYSYEHIPPFFWIEKRLINNSTFTAISSRGFENFLPSHNYIIAHNFSRNDIKKDVKFQKSNGKIPFVWNGVIRYFEFQKQYLDALKNDTRFEIIFHGDGPELEKYKNYCKMNGFNNVIFTGAYDNSQKSDLLLTAGILNNCYGYLHNAGNKLKYAVSNRFYDGMIYHIPQLVEPEGYKSYWTKKLGIGISFQASAQFSDQLYEYYHNINSVQFDSACEKALENVLHEDDKYIQMIDSFIMNEE